MIEEDWPFNRKWDYPNVGHLLCHVEGEPSPKDKVEYSLAFSLLSYDGEEPKGFIVGLAFTAYSAACLDMDVVSLFETIGNMSGKIGSSIIRNFPRDDWASSPEEIKRSIQQRFYIVEVETPKGIELDMKFGP